VTDKVIDNPILNRPYDEPSRHFAFDDEGITDRIENSRRPPSYWIVPVPRPRQGTRQLEFAEFTADGHLPLRGCFAGHRYVDVQRAGARDRIQQ
jgi:type III restriction enzyme